MINKLGRQGKGLLFGVLSAVCWGTYGTIISILSQTGIRAVTLATLVPLIMVAYAYLKATVNQRRIMVSRPQIILCMIFHGLVLLNGVNYCYIRAVETVPVGIVAVLNFSNVIIVMLASRIFFRYRLTWHKIGAVFGALFGISLILGIFQTGSLGQWTGIGWAVFIPFGYGISLVLYRFYLNFDLHEEAILFWVNLFAAAFVLLRQSPLQIYADISQAMAASADPLRIVFWLAAFAVIPLAGSYYAFFRAYQYVEPTYVSLCYALDPATAAILGFLIFDQKLGLAQLTGVGVVITAILYIKIREELEDRHPPQEAVPH